MAADGGNHRLEVVAALAGDADGVALNLGGDLELGVADEGGDLLGDGASRPSLILMTWRAWPSGEMSGLAFLHAFEADLALGEPAHDHFHERADAEFVLRRQLDFVFIELDFGVAVP